MRILTIAAIAATGIALSGCATIFEGTSQEITVNTNPEGATCVFQRQGLEVGRVANTPGAANIKKSKYDITIKCNKQGFAEASYLNHSGVTSTIAANVAADILLTGGLSSIIDSADGADNKYDSAVNVSLTPVAPSLTPAASTTTPVQGSTATPSTLAPSFSGPAN